MTRQARSSAHQPAADRPDRRATSRRRRTPSGTATWTSASSGSSRDRPSDSARVSATPWYSGVSQATTWSAAGSDATGKNVPENRNSGVMPNRKIGVELHRASSGSPRTPRSAPRMPCRSGPPPGSPARSSGDVGRPEQDDDEREDRRDRAAAARRSTAGCPARCRAPRSASHASRGRSGSTSSPLMIGNVASNDADCIADAASSPGARNAR